MIEKGTTFGDTATLSQLDSRLDTSMSDSRRRLTAEIKRLLAVLDSGDAKALAEERDRVDELRDELNQKLDSVRADMLALLRKGRRQRQFASKTRSC